MENQIIESRDLLIYLSLLYEGDWQKIMSHIAKRDPLDAETIRRAVSTLKVKCTTYLDSDYPEDLRLTPRPPFVIYYEGDLDLLYNKGQIIGVVGSREIDPEVTKAVKDIATGIASDPRATLVTGLLRGTEVESLKAALNVGKPVCVLPCGLDVEDPPSRGEVIKEAKRKGLVISIYPPGSKASAFHLFEADWLIAQLSNLLFVSSCRQKEGVLETVSIALSKGGDVACLPYRFNEGNMNNVLIGDGAALVSSAEDLLFQVGLTPIDPEGK